MKKTLSYKIVYYKKVYKFYLQPFFIKRIYIFLILKNTIENGKFNFVVRICEIRKKLMNPKLFASAKSKNFVRQSF